MHTSSTDFDIPTPTLLEISIKLDYIYLNFVVLEISSFPWNFQAGLGWGGGGGGLRIQRSFWWNYTMSLSLRLLALLQHALREGIINRLLVNPFLYPFPKYGEDYTYVWMQKNWIHGLKKTRKITYSGKQQVKIKGRFQVPWVIWLHTVPYKFQKAHRGAQWVWGKVTNGTLVKS